MSHVAAATCTDAELVEGLRRSSPGCMAECYARHGGLVYAIARRILQDPQLAEDVTQEVFIAVWEQADRFDASRGCVTTWVGRIAHNKAVDCLRRHRATGAGPAVPVMHDPLSQVDRHVDLERALDSLGDEHRRVVELSYFAGWTACEIAGHLEIPVGTVKSRMFTAMRALRQALAAPRPSVR